jgi:hypothetical protein
VWWLRSFSETQISKCNYHSQGDHNQAITPPVASISRSSWFASIPGDHWASTTQTETCLGFIVLSAFRAFVLFH